MGCSSVLPARRCWRALREFVLLNGGNAAILWRLGMKRLFRILSAAGLVLGLALAGLPAGAQQAGATIKPGTSAAIAEPKKILTMKNAAAMYANAVPNIVQQTKDVLLQNNLNYQKDLNEVAVIVAL